MKNATSYSLNLAVAALLVLASTTIVTAVGAGSDTCVGAGAVIGGTCTPLTNTTSGNNDDTAVRENTLTSNTTGTDNTAIGAGAMFFNTMGQDNTAAGLSALIHNTTGNENTATGVFALEENTSGADNTATVPFIFFNGGSVFFENIGCCEWSVIYSPASINFETPVSILFPGVITTPSS